MITTREELRARLRAEPEAHLGQRELRRVGAYELGYDLARERWRAPPLLQRVSWQAFQEWTERRFEFTGEMGCRQNAIGFASLLAKNEHAAFELYFDLYDSAIREVGGEPNPCEGGFGPTTSLVGFILDDHFKTRAGIYLGRRSLHVLWAFCNGFGWAEHDLGIDCSEDHAVMLAFQHWIDARYPFARGREWNRVINFLALDSPDRAWSAFYELFEQFRSNAPPDVMSVTASTMLANITKEVLSNDPSADESAVGETFGPVLRNIAPI